MPLTVHNNAIACDFITENETIHLAGRVIGNNIYHLIEFSNFKIAAELDGQMIIIENEDVPGIIGKEGTTLGDVNVNITHMSSGRDKGHYDALNVFNVTGNLPSDLFTKLENIKGFEKVHIAFTR